MESMRKIEAVKPVAPYLGGIFLRRERIPAAEVINDYNKEVSNFFRVLQRHYVPFIEMIRWQITTRAEFERLTATNPATLTDLERAARFLYLQKTAFGGKPSSQHFGVSVSRSGRFNITNLIPMLEDLHSRLSGVTIECLDYKAFITRYDRADTLFYLDPPYYGCEKDYGKELFGRTEFDKMAALLKGIKGAFILSLNNVPEVRKIFAKFHIKEVETAYTVAGGHRQTGARELLISNRDLFT